MAPSEFVTTPATAGERLTILAETAIDRLAGLWRAVQNRRAVAKLLDWDDRMLRDIGLTQTDLRSAMATPVGQDPSDRLSVLSSERRAAIRAEARERRGYVETVRSKSETRAGLARRSVDYPILDL